MLDVGRPGLSLTESRSHFALWAIMASPLIAGNDIRGSSAATLAILNNTDLVAVSTFEMTDLLLHAFGDVKGLNPLGGA